MYYIAAITVVHKGTTYAFCRHFKSPEDPEKIYNFVVNSIDSEFPGSSATSVVLFETSKKNFNEEFNIYTL